MNHKSSYRARKSRHARHQRQHHSVYSNIDWIPALSRAFFFAALIASAIVASQANAGTQVVQSTDRKLCMATTGLRGPNGENLPLTGNGLYSLIQQGGDQAKAAEAYLRFAGITRQQLSRPGFAGGLNVITAPCDDMQKLGFHYKQLISHQGKVAPPETGEKWKDVPPHTLGGSAPAGEAVANSPSKSTQPSGAKPLAEVMSSSDSSRFRAADPATSGIQFARAPSQKLSLPEAVAANSKPDLQSEHLVCSNGRYRFAFSAHDGNISAELTETIPPTMAGGSPLIKSLGSEPVLIEQTGDRVCPLRISYVRDEDHRDMKICMPLPSPKPAQARLAMNVAGVPIDHRDKDLNCKTMKGYKSALQPMIKTAGTVQASTSGERRTPSGIKILN